MVQNIHAHKGEKCFLPERLKDFSLTSFTRRTIPCDFCENLHGIGESRCYENDVCTRRLTHLFIHEDRNFVYVHCRCYHFLSVSPSFSPSVVTMSTSRSTGVCRINQWTKILLNMLSASRTTTMGLWLSADTVPIWNFTKWLWSQKDSQRHHITQI